MRVLGRPEGTLIDNLNRIRLELQHQRRDRHHKVEVERVTNEIVELMLPGDVLHITSSGNQLYCTWRPLRKKEKR